jgi:ClpP class serine protease
VFNAAVFTTADAMKNGLVDQAGYEKDATDYAAKLAGLTQPTIERYERRLSFFDMLGSAEGSASSEFGFDGKSVRLKVDSKMLDEAATPRMLYLWRGQ